jgi:hypothetical protein
VECGPLPPIGWDWRWGQHPPEAECESAFGVIACGYDCKSAYGEVKCAATPDGQCEASFGDIVCWDPPPPSVFVPMGAGYPTYSQFSPYGTYYAPQPQVQGNCTAAYGMIACGYDCTAAFGQLKCASTPWGRCEAAFGTVTCSDPAR